MMITGLLAGAAKTMVVTMLSERVVFRVLMILSGWAPEQKAVTEMVNLLRAKVIQ